MSTDAEANPPIPETSRIWKIAIGLGVVILTTFACLAQSHLHPRQQAAIGVVCFLGIAFFFSNNIRQVNRRTVLSGFALQLTLAILILKIQPVQLVFIELGAAAKQFLAFSWEGAKFVFGPLADNKVFALVVFPTVVFVSSFFSVLYFLGILQQVVRVFAWAMRHVMGTSGAETLSVTANVFLGQTEAPLIVRPFIPRMTRSELLALMIGGMAHISGALMAVYIEFGVDPVAIFATSVMAAPASLYIGKILIPETQKPETLGDIPKIPPSHDPENPQEPGPANVIDAAARGASEGMRLAINIAAMLFAFLAFLALINFLLSNGYGRVADYFGWQHRNLNLQIIFSELFAPVAVLMGIQGPDVPIVGELLGTKLVANEFVAFIDLTKKYHYQMPGGLSHHAYILAAFALTGFANFASIGIQLGGIGAMAEKRRADLARLGLRALLGGFLATLINASIAGILGSDVWIH